MRLSRTGDTFMGFWSRDGVNWTMLGTISVPMTLTRIHAGLAVTSHNTSTAATAIFDDVAIEP